MAIKHFIDTQDYSKAELLELIELTRQIKTMDQKGWTPKLLADATIAMILEEPSTRTRVSFEVAMHELGGQAIYLKPGEIHLGVRESLYDTAKVISRMCDGIMARTLKHETMVALAKYATVPVINGLTDYNHPTQVVSDVLTMLEHLPRGKRLEDVQVTFIGDATNVLSSLMLVTTRMGMHFIQAAPKKYQAPARWVQWAKTNCAESGGSVSMTEDPIKAIKKADFIYTDLWWWIGQEEQIPERKAAFMPDYQVNRQLFDKAPVHCQFMHCLPASRGMEATDYVMDHPRSIIFDQAENRLHTVKGLLVYLIYKRLQHPTDKEKASSQAQMKKYLGRLKE